jgi:hypothetical protein
MNNLTELRIEAACAVAAEKLATPENPWPEFLHVWDAARLEDPDIFADPPRAHIIEAASAATLAEIARRRECCAPSPWQQLYEIAQDILVREAASIRKTGNEAKQEAFQRAIERNPDLYEAWQDSLPKPTFPSGHS